MSTSCGGGSDLSMADNVDMYRDCVCNNNNNTEEEEEEGDNNVEKPPPPPPPQLSSSILPPFLLNMTKKEAINAILHRKGDYIDGTDIYLGPPRPPRREKPRPPSVDAVFELLEGTKINKQIYIGPRRPLKMPTLEHLMLAELELPPGRYRGDSVEGRSGVKHIKKKTNKKEGSFLSVNMKNKQKKNKQVATC